MQKYVFAQKMFASVYECSHEMLYYFLIVCIQNKLSYIRIFVYFLNVK